MPRIVSLIASATEIVCALGFEDQTRRPLARMRLSRSRSSVCRSAREPKFDPDGTSYEIDQRVKAIVQEGLSVYRVDGEKLRDLEPDVIVTQSHCEVCAVSLRDVERAVCAWLRACPQLVSLAPNALADVWTSIEQVADALKVPERGRGADPAACRDACAAIAERARRPVADRPTVACIEWIDPLMAAGNWMPELVEMAGGVNLFGEAGAAFAVDDVGGIVRGRSGRDSVPAVRLRHRADAARAAGADGQAGMAGVCAPCANGRVFLADGNQYFNRPGPRLVESLEILAELLHPERVRVRPRRNGMAACVSYVCTASNSTSACGRRRGPASRRPGPGSGIRCRRASCRCSRRRRRRRTAPDTCRS